MKKLLLFTLFAFFAGRSNAQTMSFVLVANPCDTNKILAVNFTTSSPPPYIVSWPYNGTYSGSYNSWAIGGPQFADTVNSMTDTLRHYDGTLMSGVSVSTLAGIYIDTGTYAGVAPPFSFTFAPIASYCGATTTTSVTVTGGTPPYSYYWYNPYTPATVATTNPATLASGVYGITIVDASGCINSSALVTAPAYLPFYSFAGAEYDSLSPTPDFTQTITVTNAVCPALGSGIVAISGGTLPLTYSWTNSSTGAVVGSSSTVSLPGGYYYETTTDALGCTQDSFLSVTVTPDFTQTVTTASAVCPAAGSGIVAVTAGTLPFTYTWTNAATGVNYVSSTSTTSLPVGYYNEITTDGLGCISLGDTGSVSYAPDFTGTVTTTIANCTNGTASVVFTGGTGPFSYLWSNGATTASISGLITGTYNVVVTDATGCIDSSAIDPSLSGYVAQSITITVGDVTTAATCIATNGSITAFGSGGTPPYSYLWSNGGATATISGLASNHYSVTATDANGCLGRGGDNVGSSTPITVTYVTTPSACTSPTGTATLSISGGTAPYTITWYTSPPQSTATATATGLPAGNYYFTITDAIGCSQSGVVTVPPIDMIYLAFTSTPATCLASDGSVSVSASGGVAPYTYSWSPVSTTSSTLSSVPYGTYYATVTDANGCNVTNCQQVPYSSPLVLGLSSTLASCLYTSNGTITETASLGTPPYTYIMNPGTSSSGSGSITVPGLATGNYWVTATDALGCTATDYTYVNYNVLDSSCFCQVQGKVYDDLAVNCIPAGDPGIQNIQLQSSGFGYTYSDDSGNYFFQLPTGTYNISQTILTQYPLSPCQMNNIPITVTAATGCYITINFADTLDPINDMHISTWDYSMPRPGFPYMQTTIVTNNGTITEPNILASYTPDGQIFSPTFVPSGIFTGAPYYYYTPASSLSLTPGTSQVFLTNYNVPTNIPLGTNVIFKDTVAYTPPMSNWLLDYSPWDNVDYFTTTTVGSFDPNFKEVNPKGTGANGLISTDDSVLEYMVHFQNTGSYMAENVTVKDTLDPNLDWTTLHPVFTADKCVVNMDDNGHVTFTFNNIDLPDSSGEPVTSNAMFTYTIKQHPNLAIGTQIKNHASIYFDFNAPVMTNTTLNTIGSPTKVPTTPAATGYNSFIIYPNPAQNTFNAIVNVSASGTYNLTICDVTGKTQISKTLNLLKGSQNITIDASRLASGIYFVTLNGFDDIIQTQKLVILKQ